MMYEKIGGFTLIETIIAMVIFSIIVLMSTSSMPSTKDFEMRSKNRVFALELAEKQIELMKTLAYGSVNSAVLVTNPATNPDSGIQFGTSVVVNTIAAGGETYKTVAVTVSWPTALTLTLNTIIAP
ncbi:MAG: prepilin-type N-terminal cleavage/methylation domain-containing protein [Elusimicrobia bacterium]|nr:prepilin-type N-terminal cleavage/methylation domain-containing protein [Candidatus Liberimonas magnetica]